MKLVSKIALVLVCFIFLIALVQTTVSAQNIGVAISPPSVNENNPNVVIVFGGLTSGETYKVCSYRLDGMVDQCDGAEKTIIASGNEVRVTACAQSGDELKFAPDCGAGDYFHNQSDGGPYKAYLFTENGEDLLATAEFEVNHVFPFEPTFSTNSPTPDDELTITLTGPVINAPPYSEKPQDHCERNDYEIIIRNDSGDELHNKEVTLSTNCSEPYQSETFPALLAGSYVLEINEEGTNFKYYTVDFTVETGGGEVSEAVRDPEGSEPTQGSRGDPTQGVNPCAGGSCKTALGSIPTDIAAFSTRFLSIGIGIAGGIALILLVIGSIRILMSSGDPKGVGAGREMIIAAVAGLLFLIFSVLILRFIGLQILGGII